MLRGIFLTKGVRIGRGIPVSDWGRAAAEPNGFEMHKCVQFLKIF